MFSPSQYLEEISWKITPQNSGYKIVRQKPELF